MEKSFIKRTLFLPLLGVSWLVAVVAGLGSMMVYQATPGMAATSAAQWPSTSHLERASDRATLVMLAHPQCPCTRASISELNTLLAQQPGKAKVYVLFLKPKGTAKNWEKTDLWRSAAAIPGVQAVTDEGGQEARRFHVSTSGQTLLFDASGQLTFSGGITGGRGHEGDNIGLDSVSSLLGTGTAKYHKTSVYGCSMFIGDDAASADKSRK